MRLKALHHLALLGAVHALTQQKAQEVEATDLHLGRTAPKRDEPELPYAFEHPKGEAHKTRCKRDTSGRPAKRRAQKAARKVNRRN